MTKLKDTNNISDILNGIDSDIIINGQVIGKSIIVLEEEVELTKEMIPSRCKEFLSGRTCARLCLETLGFYKYPLLMHLNNRAPRWPEPCVGSITHSNRYCIAAAALKKKYLGLGIDIEQSKAVTPDILPYIATKNEMTKLQLESWDWQTVVFSIKEAIYKCVNPITGVYFDFLDVEIEFLSNFEFRCNVKFLNSPFNYVQGYYFKNPFIIAIAFIPALTREN